MIRTDEITGIALFFAKSEERSDGVSKLGSSESEAFKRNAEELYFGKKIPERRIRESGKPEYPRDAGVCFSVAHSGKYFVMAFSSEYSEIGIDIENSKLSETNSNAKAEINAKAKRNVRIAERFFSESEQRRLFSVDVHEREAEFLRIWTKKEALVKLTGKGLSALRSPEADSEGKVKKGESETELKDISALACRLLPGFGGAAAVAYLK